VERRWRGIRCHGSGWEFGGRGWMLVKARWVGDGSSE
jgi:hypothetical protein